MKDMEYFTKLQSNILFCFFTWYLMIVSKAKGAWNLEEKQRSGYTSSVFFPPSYCWLGPEKNEAGLAGKGSQGSHAL